MQSQDLNRIESLFTNNSVCVIRQGLSVSAKNNTVIQMCTAERDKSRKTCGCNCCQILFYLKKN